MHILQMQVQDCSHNLSLLWCMITIMSIHNKSKAIYNINRCTAVMMHTCTYTYGNMWTHMDRWVCLLFSSDRKAERQLGSTGPMMTEHKAHLGLPGPGVALSAASCLYYEGQRPSRTSNPPLLRLPIKHPSKPPPPLPVLPLCDATQWWRC